MVFGSKSSSSSSSSRGTKLFEQPLEKLFNPKAIKLFNEQIAASNSRSPPALCQSLSAPLTSSTLTWAKLSQENSAIKRKRAAARLRRFTIDANNNNNNNNSNSSPASLITTITSGPLAHLSPASHLLSNAAGPVAHDCNTRNLCHERLVGDPNETARLEHDQCRQLLLNVLPEPIRCLLSEIYLRGPSTVGIFRKSPNAKHCRELRQKLEAIASQPPVASSPAAATATCSTSSSPSARTSQAAQKPEKPPSECQSSIEQFQVNVIASVFKEWLRSLPDCLLMSRLYPQWIDVAKLIEPLYQYKLQLDQQQQSSASRVRRDENDRRQTRDDQQAMGERRRVCTRAASHECGSAAGSPPQPPLQQQSLARALSCSVVTSSDSTPGAPASSDSGRSSSSPSPSSPAYDDPDTCGDRGDTCDSPATGSGERNSRATTASQFTPVRQNRQHSTPRAAYLKRKCYEQQRERSASEFAVSRVTSQPELTDADSAARARSQEFCMRERRLECLRVVRQLLETLNEANLILLRAIVCVLWHIAANAEHNKMSSNNLGVCIGQSLLNDEHQRHQHEAQHGGSGPTGGGGKLSSRLHTFSLNTSATGAWVGGPGNALASKDTTTSSPFAHFTKRHRRARSQCLLASTLSLTNLSHSSVGSPTSGGHAPSTTLTSSISSNYLDTSGAQEAAKYVPILVAFMIDSARELFGSDVVHLFGPALPVRGPDEPAEVRAGEEDEKVEKTKDFEAAPGTKLDQQPPAAAAVGEHENEDENENGNAKSKEMEKMLVDDKDVTRAAAGADLDAPRMSSPVKQHRRHLSTCVLVHIGSSGAGSAPLETTGPASDQVTSTRNTSEINQSGATTLKRRAPQPPGSATTSILIVNAPRAQIKKSAGREDEDEVGERDEATSCRQVKPDSPSSSLAHHVDTANCGRAQGARESDSDCGPRAPEQQQQQPKRPLSASESTGCSSRASSSTSGVHSAESPAFSCEPDSSCSSTSGSSTSSRNCRARTTTTCSSVSSSVHSSRSASISSPTSSAPSVCTSPMEIDLADEISSSANRALDSGAQTASLPETSGLPASKVLHLSHNEAMRHNLLDVINQERQRARVAGHVDQADSSAAVAAPIAQVVHTVPQQHLQARVIIPDGGGQRKFERPKSMVSLGEAERRQQVFGGQPASQQIAQPRPYQQQQMAAHRPTTLMMTAPATTRSQQGQRRHDDQNNNNNNINNNNGDDHLCRRTSYDAQLAAASANNRFQMSHPSASQSQTLGRFPARATRSATQLPGLVCPERLPKIAFQYTTSSYGGEAVLYYPGSCAHMQQQQAQHQQQHSFQHQFQHQVPQRSHVMMLRDYYLSLQEQSQQQQQYRDFLRRQHEQQSKQQMLVGAQRLASSGQPASLGHLRQSINQQQQQPSSLRAQHPVEQQQQQQPAAVAYQRIQPRMARIRPNQFNGPPGGLYVKQAPSGPAGLLVLDRRRPASEQKPKQGVSSSAASSTGHSPSDDDDDDDLSGSSDECGSAGEWMESTMV